MFDTVVSYSLRDGYRKIVYETNERISDWQCLKRCPVCGTCLQTNGMDYRCRCGYREDMHEVDKGTDKVFSNERIEAEYRNSS